MKSVIIVLIFIIVLQSLNAIIFMFINFFIIFENFKDIVLSIEKINLRAIESIVQKDNIIFNFTYVKIEEFC